MIYYCCYEFEVLKSTEFLFSQFHTNHCPKKIHIDASYKKHQMVQKCQCLKFTFAKSKEKASQFVCSS